MLNYRNFTLILYLVSALFLFSGCMQAVPAGKMSHNAFAEYQASEVPPQIRQAEQNDMAGETAGTTMVAMRDDRKVVYTANFVLRVASVQNTAMQVQKIANELGGFIQNATLDSVVFRVEPEKFENAVSLINSLGEVEEKNILSSDVTAEYTDLSLRIEVAQKSQQRLLTLIDRLDKTKDILEAERDIRRLTEEIETLKGKLRVMENQISWSTISVRLREKIHDQSFSYRKQQGPRFMWMNQVGIDRVLRPVSPYAPLSGCPLGNPFRLNVDKDSDVPEDFVKLMHTRNELIASTSEDYRLRLRKLELRQNADLKFWVMALANELEDVRGYDLGNAESFDIGTTGLKAFTIRGETDFDGLRWTYDLWLIQRENDADSLLVIEYARMKRDADKFLKNITNAIKGLRFKWIGPWG